jgi:hypothetical protein
MDPQFWAYGQFTQEALWQRRHTGAAIVKCTSNRALLVLLFDELFTGAVSWLGTLRQRQEHGAGSGSQAPTYSARRLCR